MIKYMKLMKIAAVSILLLSPLTASTDEMTGHIGGLVGMKTMDNDDWPELDTHFALGMIFDIKRESWPVSFALDIIGTGDRHEHDGMEDLGHTLEYQLGVRKIFTDDNSRFQPYIGGGVSYMYAELELENNNVTTTQDDTDVGFWLGAGTYYEITSAFVIGLDLRYSHAEVTLFNSERNAGGILTAVSVAYQF